MTEVSNDAAMITAVADNRRVTDAYNELTEVPEFRQRVMAFARMWPVLNFRDVRKKIGREAFWIEDREVLLKRCMREGVKYQSLEWTEGDIPTWPQLMRTIYCIRCNLFHGVKSPQNSRDRELILWADRILRSFIEGSGCFEWYN